MAFSGACFVLQENKAPDKNTTKKYNDGIFIGKEINYESIYLSAQDVVLSQINQAYTIILLNL